MRSQRINCSSDTYWNFAPLSVLFFPIVERLSIYFVDRRLSDFHVARFSSQKEIDVVGLAIGGFHIDAGEIFSATEIRKAVIVVRGALAPAQAVSAQGKNRPLLPA